MGVMKVWVLDLLNTDVYLDRFQKSLLKDDYLLFGFNDPDSVRFILKDDPIGDREKLALKSDLMELYIEKCSDFLYTIDDLTSLNEEISSYIKDESQEQIFDLTPGCPRASRLIVTPKMFLEKIETTPKNNEPNKVSTKDDTEDKKRLVNIHAEVSFQCGKERLYFNSSTIQLDFGCILVSGLLTEDFSLDWKRTANNGDIDYEIYGVPDKLATKDYDYSLIRKDGKIFRIHGVYPSLRIHLNNDKSKNGCLNIVVPILSMKTMTTFIYKVHDGLSEIISGETHRSIARVVEWMKNERKYDDGIMIDYCLYMEAIDG